MAEAVGRSTSMLRKWESGGSFPKPLFQSEIERGELQGNRAFDRYYSRYQVALANRLAKKHGMLQKKMVSADFFTKLMEKFYQERETVMKVI